MKTTLLKTFLVFFALLMVSTIYGQTGWQIDQVDTPFTIDFDNTVAGVNNGQFDGTGFAPSPSAGQLNSNAITMTGMSDGSLAFGDNNNSADFARGTNPGVVNTGGVYAFDIATGNRALGVQPGGSDFTPGSIILRFQNKTGGTITDLILSYKIFVLNDQPRSNSFNFSYSADNVNYTDVASLDFATTESADPSPVWSKREKYTVISGLNLADDGIMYLKWTSNDISGSSNRDEIAIDDIQLIVNPSSIDYTFNNTWSPQDPSGVSRLVDNINVQSGVATITDNTQSKNVTITTSSSLQVNSNSTLEISGDLTVDGDLIFKSDASRSAQLVHATSSNLIGEITVERYIPAKRAFRFLTSPVGGQSFAASWQQGTHITGEGGANNGFDETTTDSPSLFVYDNQVTTTANGAAWEAVTSTNDTLQAGKPYRILVRGDREEVDLSDNQSGPSVTTLISKGNMLSGELTTGNQLPALSPLADKFSFVANPYQAVVDFTKVATSDLTEFIYVWDAQIAGDNGNGGYLNVALDGSAPNPSSSDASKFLIPGQSFFVKNIETLTGAPSLTFSPNAIVSSELQPEILSTSELAYINIRLYKAQDFVNGSMEADAVGLRFSDEFTTSPSDEDADKLINPGENMVIFNEKILSIDKRNFPENDEKIQLAMANFKQNEYTLAFYSDYLPEDKKLILIDNYLQEEIEVTDDFSYNFTVDSSIEGSDDQSRFQLMLTPVTLGQDDYLVNSVRIYPNPATDFLNLGGVNNSSISDVEIYSMLGQKLNSDFITTEKGIQLDVSALNTGLYLVKIKTEKGITTRRFIKN
jgi:hypothetical protein